jgi:hypothetical protein
VAPRHVPARALRLSGALRSDGWRGGSRTRAGAVSESGPKSTIGHHEVREQLRGFPCTPRLETSPSPPAHLAAPSAVNLIVPIGPALTRSTRTHPLDAHTRMEKLNMWTDGEASPAPTHLSPDRALHLLPRRRDSHEPYLSPQFLCQTATHPRPRPGSRLPCGAGAFAPFPQIVADRRHCLCAYGEGAGYGMTSGG